MDLKTITTPTLLLNQEKCLRNIQFMNQKAQKQNVLFRPHFKTHQSKMVGSWFKDFGVDKIAVSSLQMANYFADEWDDITIAFPANIRQIDLINKLAKKITLNLTIENIESVEYLTKHLESPVNYFIKIDAGYRRTGITFDIFPTIEKVLKATKKADKLTFKGFLSHFGNTYHAKSPDEIKDIYNTSVQKLNLLKEEFSADYPDLIMSTGDTPSCSLIDHFEGIDEIRPGNFVFYDLMQYRLGSCKLDDIAVVMACPVVAKHSDRQEIIIFGGGVHFSKEYIEMNDQKIYGQIVFLSDKGWEIPDNESYLVKLSQEHGTIKASDHLFDQIKIGDLVGIIPVHSCLTANLMRTYLSTDNQKIDHISGSL